MVQRSAGAFLSVLVMTVAAGCGAADPAVRTLRVFDFLAAYPRATVEGAGPNHVHVQASSVGGQEKQVLFMHAASTAEFPPVEVGQDSVFTAFIGIDDQVRAEDGDGVEFTVSLRLPNGDVVKLFSRFIDPKQNEQDRAWVALRLPLGSFVGQAVRVILISGPGPKGNAGHDWGLWGEPQILLDSK